MSLMSRYIFDKLPIITVSFFLLLALFSILHGNLFYDEQEEMSDTVTCFHADLKSMILAA